MRRILLPLLLTFVSAIAFAQAKPWPAAPAKLPEVGHAKLAKVEDWAYWIQDPDLKALADSKYDLVVIDYSADGTQATAFSKDDIATLRRTGKLVVAYLSVGEAENYRYYWGLAKGKPGADWAKQPPDWLGEENPDWEGNFKVKFWEPEWQQLVIHNDGDHPVLGNEKSYLDRILDAEFDGVFLDVVDAFEYWGPEDDGGNGKRETAAADMAKFVVALAAHARKHAEGFIVCQQNAEGLISTDLEQPLNNEARIELLAAVDWLSVEDVIYRGKLEQNNPYKPDLYRVKLIDAYRKHGKLVTIIDYFDETKPGFKQDALDDYWKKAADRSWLPWSGPRALDRTPTWKGHEPK